MSKLPAFLAIALVASCSSKPTAEDYSLAVGAALNSLYSQIDENVAVAGLCARGKTNVSPQTFANVSVKKIQVVQCSNLDLFNPGERLRTKGSNELAVVLSVDKVAFGSSTSATVTAHYSYGGLDAAGFTLTLEKVKQNWLVITQKDLWVS